MAEGDFAILDGWISGLRSLGREGITEIAREAAPAIEREARRTAAAGVDPFGKPWAPRKKDGERPMVDAASHVSVSSAGPTLRVKLTGPDVFHQFRVRGEPERKVIPDATDPIPPSYGRAIQNAMSSVFARRLGAA